MFQKIIKETIYFSWKKNYVYKYNEIKKIFPKKGIKKISEELDIPKTCLMEWIKQIDFL